jgi:KDO2-lipid IV(A) lauroyltransferase
MRHQSPPPQPETGRSHRHRFETPFWRRVMLFGVRNIPQPLQRLSMPFWAGIFYTLVPSARRAVEANLVRVLGDGDPVRTHIRSFKLFVNYAQAITDTYAMHLGQRLPVDAIAGGRELVARLKRDGRGAIFVTGHFGWWSLSPYVMELTGLSAPVLAMAEEPNARLQEFEQRFRQKWRIVYTTGSPFASLELAAVLRRGETVAMQMDRSLGGPSVSVPFFGRPARFPLGPATLARVTGAPLVPTFMVREGWKGFRAVAEEPIEVEHTADRAADLRAATERVVRIYESYVRRYPLQWFNFHDFWAEANGTEANGSG